jgi:hypothetical protein
MRVSSRFGFFPIVSSLLISLVPAARAQGYVLWQYEGTAAAETTGWRVAGIGDVNGDGLGDLVVAKPACTFYFCGSSGLGQATVLSGATGTPLFTVVGATSGDGFARSVDGAGDVNGDNVPDIVVGAPLVDNGAFALSNSGEATVFSGAGGAPLFVLSGTVSNEQLGVSVAGAGDVNADGFADVIVGAAGQVKVFTGPTGTLLHTFTGSGSFGQAVETVGDVNGDGADDVVVGNMGGGFGAGEATVYSGLAGSILQTFGGSGGQFGEAVAPARDVNADGIPDLMVGASFIDPGSVPHGGQVQVFSVVGAGALLVPTIYGTVPHDHIGWPGSIEGAGDLNGDGFGDLLIGAHQSSSPPGPGALRMYSGSNGSLLYEFVGGAPGDYLGWSVANLGDASGDGIPDVASGSPGADPMGLTDAGRVTAFSIAGIPPGSSTFGSGCPGSGGSIPVIQTSGGPPDVLVGNPTFSLVLSKALPNAPALLIAGASNATWLGFGIPLPLSLAPFGFPACSLRVSVDVQVTTTTTGAGLRFVPMPVPAIGSLVGQSIYFQWFVLDPPGAMTQGLQLVL